MTLEYVLSFAAEQDIDEIISYIARANPASAKKFCNDSPYLDLTSGILLPLCLIGHAHGHAHVHGNDAARAV
jgi:hypothetical protein